MAVTRSALEAGKHVYSEKPLAVTAADAAELVRFAECQGKRIGCAPDIFLGRAYQTARALLDEGAIGEPLAASAAMVGGGQERWHPDPDTFFRNGAGPLLDMGPYYLTAIVALLGPVRRVTGFASTLVTERRIEIGPRTGEVFAAETPTHTAALLELAGGLPATLVATFEAPGNYSSMLVVHGTEGELALPDPNAFEGPVQIQAPGWLGGRFVCPRGRSRRARARPPRPRRSHRRGSAATAPRRSSPRTSSTLRRRSSSPASAVPW